MAYKTVTVDVDVDIEMDDFDDDEIIRELEDRGYKCISKDDHNEDHLSMNDVQVLLELLDSDARNWEHRRIRDKLMDACKPNSVK